MKRLHWIIIAVLTAMFVAVGCSTNEEPTIPAHYIKDGKIYIHLYGPEGMKYAPVSAEDLPQCVKDMFKSIFELERAIVFEGEYDGHHTYWMHGCYSSSFFPNRVYIDGSLPDEVVSFGEVYPNLTCIYIGEHYFHQYR